ncbi:hypothetical protein ALC56_09661 [Trachymyrmex septentrionalis]|uniref:Uncharacterized protein n=2 Tax=Trachymyrmex septentrionalis TaxID=34720 RepID=A0A195F5K3_9HYME|nr:hypothetical protein ALC56_09661 [Trachymyrmex septentrionalis]
MPVKGVRVLPDIPKNMPNMEILIQEFETGFRSTSTNYQDIASKSSTSNDGNFVKKLVKAYESSARASNENNQREETKETFGFFNTLDVTQNQKNIEKNDLNLVTYDTPSLQCQNNLNKKSNIFLTSFEECEVEDDFVIINRYRSDKKPVSMTWPRSSSKINMYSSIDDDILMNVQSSPSKKNEMWDLKKRDIKLEDNSMKNKLMIYSSPLEDVEDTNLDCEDPLDDILTSSCDSSSNNSYRNLQADLYDFENKQWQLELSSSSLSSLSSSSKSSYNDLLNINSNLLLDSSFQDITVTSSKNIPKNQENLQNFKPVSSSSSNFDWKSPPAIGASLNEDQPIKINDDTCITWISALGEKLSRKKPLKKLLNSTFYTKLLNYKKVWKKSAEKQPNKRTSDSGFIDGFLSSSSSSSQKSWRSNPDEKPTFSTFGHTENNCVNNKMSKSSCMVLTEEPCTTTVYKENRQNIESSLKSMIPVNSSTLKVSCGYPPLLKHPYLTRNEIPKHPFVTKTKLDQTIEKESDDEEMRYDAKECKSELESSSISLVSEADLDILFSRTSEWLTSSPNNNCDLLR